MISGMTQPNPAPDQYNPFAEDYHRPGDGSVDPFGGIADRAARLAARTEATLAAWEHHEQDPRPYYATQKDRPESRKYGFARGEGWCLSTGGIEDFKSEGEGLIDGHVVYYSAYGTIQAKRPDWSVKIAPEGVFDAVTIGWSAGGRDGWIVEGYEDDDPDLPKATTRPGAWARMDKVVAAFRAGRARWFDAVAGTDYPLARRLLVDISRMGQRKMLTEAWLDIPHPVLGGRTPDAAVHAGEYRRVNALVLAEREDFEWAEAAERRSS